MINRLLNRLRWPMALLAASVLAAALASGWRCLRGGYIFKAGGPDMCVLLSDGALLFACGHTGTSVPGDSYAGAYFDGGSPDPQWSWDQWRRFEMDRHPSGCLRVVIPAWTIVLLLSAVSFAGFRSRRALAVPGQCQACRHRLQGAVVCPECGRPALPN
jgi:hypothetical protein